MTQAKGNGFSGDIPARMQALSITDVPASRNVFEDMPGLAMEWLKPQYEPQPTDLPLHEGIMPLVMELGIHGQQEGRRFASMPHFRKDNMWFASNGFETYNSNFLRAIVPAVSKIDVVYARSVYMNSGNNLLIGETVQFDDGTVFNSRTSRGSDGAFRTMSQYMCIEDGEETEYLIVRNTEFPCTICGFQGMLCRCSYDLKVRSRACGLTPVNNNSTLGLTWPKWCEFIGDVFNYKRAVCALTLHRIKRSSVHSVHSINTLVSYHVYQAGSEMLNTERDKFIMEYIRRQGLRRALADPPMPHENGGALTMPEQQFAPVEEYESGTAEEASEWSASQAPPAQIDTVAQVDELYVSALLEDVEDGGFKETTSMLLEGPDGVDAIIQGGYGINVSANSDEAVASSTAGGENDSAGDKSEQDLREEPDAAKLLFCDQCNRAFKRRYDLRRHIAGVHERVHKYDCKVCGEKYLHVSHLRRHVASAHTAINVPGIERCDVSSNSAPGVRPELGAATPELGSSNAGTDDSVVDRATALRIDADSDHHDADKKFNCDQCNKAFKRRYDLRRHVTTVHEKVRKFECKQCGLKFLQAAHLNEHIASVHEKVRSNFCEKCNLTFTSKSRLTRHDKAVHLRLRPYFCGTCGNRYFQRTDLKKHELVKHGIVHHETVEAGN